MIEWRGAVEIVCGALLLLGLLTRLAEARTDFAMLLGRCFC